MKEIVIASNNSSKIEEIKQIMGGCFDRMYSPKELGIDIDVLESGGSFYENALIKARAISDLTGKSALADDSGLTAEALNGAPGVFSARYAGYPADDKKNIEKLLNELSEQKNRRAAFVCCIVIYNRDGSVITAEGRVEGEILEEKRGEGGFGYDPVFYSYELKKTFAQATQQEKNSVSHRARALKAIELILRQGQ